MKYIAFCSGGKDSTAMVDLLIKCNIPLDEVVFITNSMEFPKEKEFRDFLIFSWEHRVQCTVLQTQTTWDEWFYGKITKGKYKGLKRGYPLTLYPCYWTRESKIKVIEDYLKIQEDDIIQYIGYTKDEKSTTRQNIKWQYFGNHIKGKRFPLIDWGMKEKDCYDYCYEHGILNPLYYHFKRLGCYLCPKQNETSLRELKEYFPAEWDKLRMYCEDTCSQDFVSPGQFNLEFNAKNLYKI